MNTQMTQLDGIVLLLHISLSIFPESLLLQVGLWLIVKPSACFMGFSSTVILQHRITTTARFMSSHYTKPSQTYTVCFFRPAFRVLKVFLSRTAQRTPYMTSWRVLRLLLVILLVVLWFLVAWTSAMCQKPELSQVFITAGLTADGLQFSMCLLDRWDYMTALGESRVLSSCDRNNISPLKLVVKSDTSNSKKIKSNRKQWFCLGLTASVTLWETLAACWLLHEQYKVLRLYWELGSKGKPPATLQNWNRKKTNQRKRFWLNCYWT